jgi:hypothetical protein
MINEDIIRDTIDASILTEESITMLNTNDGAKHARTIESISTITKAGIQMEEATTIMTTMVEKVRNKYERHAS